MRTPLRQLSLCAAALLLAALPVSAQEPTTLTGTVTTRSGAPVETGTVFIESMSLGVLTNAQGRYVLIVPAAARAGNTTVDVTAQLIGYTTEVQTVTLQPGTQVLNFVLGEDPLRLAGVTVTALGLERQSRELGISTSQIAGAELTRAEPNLINTLTGRVAGVHINNSGPQGGSSRMVIRGENSMLSSNQPLFVIDGVPVDNSEGSGAGILTVASGIDYGNNIQDIMPDNIASITVLKGPNAAALYGSRAANGAVLIETKRGQNTPGGAEIVVSQQVTFEDELRLPSYQNQFGIGYYGEYAFFDGDGNGINDQADESWGPPLDAGLMIPQWFSDFDTSLPGCNPGGTATERVACRVPEPWVSHPNNVDNFFETGVTSTTNVSVAGSTENVHGRASFSRMGLNGMQPGHELDRKTFSLAGGIEALDRLNVNASAQYIASEGLNRPGVGYGGDNIMHQFVWWGRNVDTNQLKELYDAERPLTEPNIGGFPYNWTTHYWLNPYFRALENVNSDSRDRLIGQVSARYEFTDWLSAQVRTGTDWYRDERRKEYAANLGLTIAGDYTGNPLTGAEETLDAGGSFSVWDIGQQETNTDFLISAAPELNLPFTTSLTLGGNRRDIERTNDYTWVGALLTPGVYDVNNAAVTPDREDLVSRKRVNSLYGQLDLGYNDYLFLTFTGRNDWSSTLPEDNRSYIYPSVSGSFVFSEVVEALQGSALSYGKVRASWARVGNDTAPYQLRNTFAPRDLWGGIQTFSLPGRLQNDDLKPEVTESWEFGTELAFLENRLGLDVTYYIEETRDQLMPVQVSEASGRIERMVNAGTVQNKGWEVLLRGTPYASSNFRWESTLTWAKNDSEVVELAPGVEGLEISLGGGAGGQWFASLFAREGEPLGQIVGARYLRADQDGDGEPDPNGPIVVDAGLGIPLWEDNEVIGNANPDWRAGWFNEFSYGGARLSFLWDMRQGGEIYSITNAFGRFSGVLEETVEGRCTPGGPDLPGYPTCDANTGIVVEGVNETSPGVYVPNTTVVDAETFWLFNFFVPEQNLEDASYVKLREATLSYLLPETWTSRWGVDAVEVAVVGRNLLLFTDARHIDPETSLEGTNVQGFEYGQMPSARSIGFNVTVRP